MMRKLFWGCAAAGLALAGGLFGVAHYAVENPDSHLGRCVREVADLSMAINPVTGLAPILADQIGRGSPAPQGAEDAQEGEVACAEGVPAEPVPVAEDGDLKPPAEAAEPAEKTPEVPLPGVIEVSPEPPQADEAPVTTIPEEQTAPAGVGVTQTEEPGTFQVPNAEGEGVAIPAGCPRSMPYCGDEEECEELPMPAECAEGEGKAGGPSLMSFWAGFFKGACGWACPCRGEAGKDQEPSFWMRLIQGACDSAAGEGEAEQPGCHQGSHSPCPACPYTGRSCPSCPSAGSCAPLKGDPAGGEEPSEEGTPKKKRKCAEDDPCPTHPEVDTMEFRPSDGNLYDYGVGDPL
jgi:hypothetical protein